VSEGRWRITVTAPDWGQDHLSSDAIVAYVDDELAHGPHLRATQHLAQCLECAGQVVAQGQARAALRTAGCPSLPSSLLTSLRSIPQDADLPAPPAGLAVTPDGQLVSVLRPERFVAPAPEHADLAAAAPATAAQAHATDHGRRPQRRLRLGTGVAVSGLAIGAIAFALPAASSAVPAPVPTAADGVLGGSVLGGGASGVVDAQLRLTPATTPASSPEPTREPALEQLDRVPYGLP
jgi:hypothetical protein